MKILLADDHPIVTAFLESLLKRNGHEIVAVERDGGSVLERLSAARPEVLVLDVEMPMRSGLDVLRTLRQRGDTRPVVLLTGSLKTSAAIEAVKLGVNGIILKDKAAESILECLNTIQSGRRWIEPEVLQKSLDQALSKNAADDPLQDLTPKERAVAGLVARGLRNQEIAEELRVSVGTVKVHLNSIFQKLNISSRTELALIARRAED
jgi:two-component system, NarL family, nitrate/nitrite response regulator NarL